MGHSRQLHTLHRIAAHITPPFAPAAAASDTAPEVTFDLDTAGVSLRQPAGAEERQLLSTAERVFPGGITGNSCPKGIVVAKGEGPHIWDRSGNKYLDLAMGSGPMFIGHRYSYRCMARN